jgi:hypothetical protein
LSEWRYAPAPELVPLPCQLCASAPGTVAVYHRLVWIQTLCQACAREHRVVYEAQLGLFEETL